MLFEQQEIRIIMQNDRSLLSDMQRRSLNFKKQSIRNLAGEIMDFVVILMMQINSEMVLASEFGTVTETIHVLRRVLVFPIVRSIT